MRDKILEIIREYKNGCDADITADYILDQIENLLLDEDNEPKSLREISKVKVKFDRVILEVFDPMFSRFFGLFDNAVRYEFDGTTMWAYYGDGHSWSWSCGNGSYTLVTDAVSKCANAVKKEMVMQIVEKGLKVNQAVAYGLNPMNCGIPASRLF